MKNSIKFGSRTAKFKNGVMLDLNGLKKKSIFMDQEQIQVLLTTSLKQLLEMKEQAALIIQLVKMTMF